MQPAAMDFVRPAPEVMQDQADQALVEMTDLNTKEALQTIQEDAEGIMETNVEADVPEVPVGPEGDSADEGTGDYYDGPVVVQRTVIHVRPVPAASVAATTGGDIGRVQDLEDPDDPASAPAAPAATGGPGPA